MKKLMLVLLLNFISIYSFSQWTYKTINSEFDGSFKKAYTQTDNGGFLFMEVGSSTYNDTIEIKRPFLGLVGRYFCDDVAYVDFVLVVKGINRKYEFRYFKSNDSRKYYFDESIWTSDFIEDFKNATKCLIRVNQDYCTDDYYTFNMSNSTSAFKFITK